jgi:hypothetical protein
MPRTCPGQIVGYRRDGRPIHAIAGAAEDSEGATVGQAGEDAIFQQPEGEQAGAQPEAERGQPEQPRERTYSQAEVDGQLRAARLKYQRQIEEEREKSGKNESERLTLERDRAVEDRDRTRSESGARIAATEAKVTAIAAGAKPERADAVARNADLTDAVGEDGEVDTSKIKAAVDKVLSDFPEWKASTTPKSGGDIGGGPPEPTAAEFAKMPYSERVALFQRDADLYRRLAGQL